MRGLLKHCESFARRRFQAKGLAREFIKKSYLLLNKTHGKLYCYGNPTSKCRSGICISKNPFFRSRC
jgi:hypothetical protein